MVKALLICIGSRGDAEPFAALAARLLQDEDNSVELFVQPELKGLAPSYSENLTVHELPFTQQDFFKYSRNPTKGVDHENERVRFVGVIAEVIAGLCLPLIKSVYQVAKDCDVMITSALARWLCFAVSSKLEIPTILIHLQQLVPTRAYPHYAELDKCVKAIMNCDNGGDPPTIEETDEWLEVYWLFERSQLEFLQVELDEMYDAIELKPYMNFELLKSILLGNDSKTYIACCVNEELIPKVTDAGPNVTHIGSLADQNIPKGFEPPTELVEFLEMNPKPICVGFGSMPCNQVNLLLEALEEVGDNAVLVGKALAVPEDNEWAKGNVVQVDSAPYAWLLPQCKLMVCHGGAGVTQTTLHAGIPIVVSPYFGDQFFHAELCKAKGLGSRAGPVLPKATKEDFVSGIGEALGCVDEAKEFGEKTRSKSVSVDSLKALISKVVAK